MAQDKRVFSEQEVAVIIRRAAEMQEQSPGSTSDYRLGVTREELERAAQEVGVSPEFLKAAIEEKLAGKRSGRAFTIAPEEERVVEGEIDPKDFDLILEHVPVRHSRRFPITQVGHTMSMRARNGFGIARVEVNSRNGRTRIRVKPFPILEALLTFYPAFIVCMTAAAPLAESGNVLASAAVAAGAFGAAVLGFLGWTRKSRQNAARLADKLGQSLTEEIQAIDRQRLANATPPVSEPASESLRTNA